MLRIGVIGCGAIGEEICKAIDRGLVPAMLAGIIDIDQAKANALSKGLTRSVPVLPVAEVIKESELVVEAVSKAAAPAIIRETLALSKDIIVMSAGGLLDCLDDA